jgi:hypothetical protein
MTTQEWLLFNSQLPASPSSARVMVWRKMRAAGAVSLQNGVWLLPNFPEPAALMEELRTYVINQGGSSQLFAVNAFEPETEIEVMAQFAADRQAEYDEFSEHCQEFLDELARETVEQKFTYGELEESEANLDRLNKWLPKIQERDFWRNDLTVTATAQLEACRQALEAFTLAVYTAEGFDAADNV